MDWGNMGEVTDWNDLAAMMGKKGDKAAGAAEPPQSSAEKEQKPGERSARAAAAAQPERSAKLSEGSELGNLQVDGWTDMKQFDDDHDPDWFEEEERRLSKLYGGMFIKVKYTEQGRPGYFCELCLAEMNAKKSLESHCEGMKHLKKKAIWEKTNSEKEEGSGPGFNLEGRQGGWSDNASSQRNREASRVRDRSPFRGGRDRYSPRRDRDRRGGSRRDDRDDMHSRDGGRSDDRSFGRQDRGYGGRPDDRRGGMDDRLSRSDDRSGRIGDRLERQDDRYGDYPGDRDRMQRAKRSEGGGGWVDDRDGYKSGSMPPSSSAATKEKLSGGTTGILLTKLASCYIKDEEDADLALSVVSSLASSLREYNTKKGEKKIAELLMEAELKLNTLKALKVGLKLLGNKDPNTAPLSGGFSVLSGLPGTMGGSANGNFYGLSQPSIMPPPPTSMLVPYGNDGPMSHSRMPPPSNYSTSPPDHYSSMGLPGRMNPPPY